MNRPLVLRVGLALLAVTAVVVGVWAGFAPRSFYDDFPGFGRHWVAADGPFNEHLVRDVGWLNLALAVTTVAAAITLARGIVRASLAAWLVSAVPHLLYHATHLDELGTGDQIAMIASLAVAPVLAVALLVVAAPAREKAKVP
jgi:hypothetical protein